MASDVYSRSSHGIETYAHILKDEVQELRRIQEKQEGNYEIKKRDERTRQKIIKKYPLIEDKISSGETPKYIAGVLKISENVHNCVQINLSKYDENNHFPEGITNVVTGLNPTLLSQLDLYLSINTDIKNYLEAAETTRRAIMVSIPPVQKDIFVATEPWGITSDCYGIGRSITWLMRFEIKETIEGTSPMYAPILTQLPYHSLFPVGADKKMEVPVLVLPKNEEGKPSELEIVLGSIGRTLGLSDITNLVTITEFPFSWQDAADLGFLWHVFEELSIRHLRFPIARAILDQCSAHISLLGDSCGVSPVRNPKDISKRTEDLFGASKGQLNDHIFGVTEYAFEDKERRSWRILRNDL